MPVSDKKSSASNAAGKVAKIVFLSLFALVLVVVSVSFAVHHMRLGFEKEFQKTLIQRVQTDAGNAALAVSGEEIKADSSKPAQKYSSVLPYMLMDVNDDDYTTQVFGLYEYTNGSLNMLTGNDSDLLIAKTIPVSEWLTSEGTPSEIFSNPEGIRQAGLELPQDLSLLYELGKIFRSKPKVGGIKSHVSL